MGYNKESHSGSGKDRCVTDVVHGIVEAQREVVENNSDSCCSTSCEQSIEDLLSPSVERPSRPRHNTIPFMLICKSTCKPFIGSGVFKEEGSFYCIESPVFRVKKFVKGSNSCVIIELLVPNQEQVPTAVDGDSVCKYFEGGIESFRPTGVCITIDLNCFCGITCLDPITIN